jgi:hypothetical protein
VGPPPDHLIQCAHVVLHIKPYLNPLQSPYPFLEVQANLAGNIPQVPLFNPGRFVGDEVVLPGADSHKLLKPRDGIALRERIHGDESILRVWLAVQLFKVLILLEVGQKPNASLHEWVFRIANTGVWRGKGDEEIHAILVSLQMLE